jgi:molecular chaperone GrpE (heat shock protein)
MNVFIENKNELEEESNISKLLKKFENIRKETEKEKNTFKKEVNF